MEDGKGPAGTPGPGDPAGAPARKKPGITIPFIRKTVSLRVLGSLVAFIALFALLGTFITIRETNRPSFCFSCHEMDVYYDSWKNSPHKDLQCVECHISPGTQNMIIHKAKSLRQVYVHFKGVKPGDIKGHVPDINCTRCHKESKELVEYHSLKITHRKHQAMGLKCVFCHINVVHGAESDFLHAPPMATCITCHEGKKASNKCGTCHAGEIERDRSPFSGQWIEKHRQNIRSQGEDSCRKCHHADYCKSCHRTFFPHPRDYESTPHIGDAKKNEASCRRCHETKFCDACHAMKFQHPIEWERTHVDEAEKDRKKCAECHSEDFCADCHSSLARHQTGFLKMHSREARQHPNRCSACHDKSYCVKCHQKSEPSSHQGKNWIARHKIDAARNEASCALCHTKDFCARCHRSIKPSTHNETWTKAHGGIAMEDEKACMACHDREKYCDGCHTTHMPHSQQWKSTHGQRRNEGFCLRCHPEKECSACHRSRKPASHGMIWRKNHGSEMMAGKEDCFTCHGKASCDACHGLTLPHPMSWGTGHKVAFSSEGARCDRCHAREECINCHKNVTPPSHKGARWKKDHKKDKGHEAQCAVCHPARGSRDACTTCHGGLQMPHPENYGMAHTKDSMESPSSCIKCHQREECLKCHQAMPPSNHKDEWKVKGHKQDALKRRDLCKACHDAGTCIKCHPEEKSRKR
jgi:nitrate/TMAO reductase-like tetraheme cytochrome c subunit